MRSGVGQFRFELSAEESRRITEFAREQTVTTATVFNAAWSVMLSRRLDTTDVVYGVTVSGRPARLNGIEKAVGMFINSLPVRTRVNSKESVSAFLRRLQSTLFKMRNFEHCGIADIREYCDFPPGEPLFDTLVAFENYPDVFDIDESNPPDGALTLGDFEYFEKSDIPVVLVVIPGETLRLHCVFHSFVCNRSGELVLAMLAIMKSGHAFVPIDPANPQLHNSGPLENCDLVLTIPQYAGKNSSVTELVLDEQCLRECHETEIATPHQPDVNPESPAYTIFTSGSTGCPRGVVVSHRSIVASNLARTQFYATNPGVFLLLSGVAFDSGLAGIFWTLTTGGTLVIPPTGLEHDISRVIDSLIKNRVTHTLCLPAIYRFIAEHPKAADIVDLKTVIVAGETCSPDLIQRHFRSSQFRATKLVNEYGPTEAGVWATAHQCESDDLQGVPIGRAIGDMQVLLLDSQYRPVPAGVTGEIFLTGPQLAIEYLNAPEETSARFVSLAVNGAPARRFYRTGDMGWFRGDATLMFAGRIDQQFKRRGYRVEATAIEDSIRQHADVREVAVLRCRSERNDDSATATVDSLYTQLKKLPSQQAEALLNRVAQTPENIVSELLKQR